MDSIDNKTLSNEWFEYAKEDIESAEFLTNKVKVPYEIICYHCQQSAEKMLKGFIAFSHGKLQKTHDLILLCEMCKEYDNSFSEILDQCLRLTSYSSEIRYPNKLEVDEGTMKQALSSARLIMDFVLGKIGG